MFVHYNGKIVNTQTIEWVDYSNLSKMGYIRVHCAGSAGEIVEGPQAYDLVMRLCPEVTEGQNLKQQRGRWAIHNLFGHPLMQILAWLGLVGLGLKIHDKTVPNPITK
jgi:hypothetical protein